MPSLLSAEIHQICTVSLRVSPRQGEPGWERRGPRRDDQLHSPSVGFRVASHDLAGLDDEGRAKEAEPTMAEPRQKNFVERLADVGEEAIQRIGSAPGGEKIVGTLGSMRERLDELTRRVRGLEDMEKRIDVLERRVDKLEGKPEGPDTSSASEAPTKAASSSTRTTKAAPEKSTPTSPAGDST